MQNDDIIERLTKIFRNLFENSSLCLSPETSAKDVKGWDSMANIMLAIEIEHEFRVRIKPAEMEAMRNVGELTDLIKQHQQPAIS